MDAKSSIAFRESLTEAQRKERTNMIVYLSEMPDGSIGGTEKMTRRDYALSQKRRRIEMGEAAAGLSFAESEQSVRYRCFIGMLRSEKEYGRWVVWEEIGNRFESSKNSIGNSRAKNYYAGGKAVTEEVAAKKKAVKKEVKKVLNKRVSKKKAA